MSILGDYATLYLMVSVTLLLLGFLGALAYASSPMRRRYVRMMIAAPVWPAAVAYALLRPPTR